MPRSPPETEGRPLELAPRPRQSLEPPFRGANLSRRRPPETESGSPELAPHSRQSLKLPFRGANLSRRRRPAGVNRSNY